VTATNRTTPGGVRGREDRRKKEERRKRKKEKGRRKEETPTRLPDAGRVERTGLVVS
jgi:hypothetical protein